MSLPVTFLMIVLKKSAVHREFPCGEAGFRDRYPHAVEDRYLFGLGSMSGQELDEVLAELRAAGVDTSRSGAVADWQLGVISPHPDILFERCGPADFPRFRARLVRDDPAEMAREGEGIVRWLLARGFSLELPVGKAGTSDKVAPQ